MKHPIDTSAWGEFMVGELFETNGNKTYTGAGIPKNNLEAGSTPRITVTDKNNGIIGSFNDTDNTNYRVYENFISVSFLGTVFWHPYKASVDMKVHVLNKLNGAELTEKRALFLVACIKKTIATFNYAEQLSASKLYKLSIPLPLKPSANPSNYTQDDIDWDYMDTVMSRVTTRAKERLANLPAHEQRSKTPVDTSAWGDFVVGELFDNIYSVRQVKSQRNIVDELKGIPFVVQTQTNNMVKCYASKNTFNEHNVPIIKGNSIAMGVDLAVISYQENDYGGSHIIVAESDKLNPLRGKFIVAIMTAKLGPKYNYVNKPGVQKYKQDVIPLPLKPSADPSDYTQDDIDWDYMDSFMQAIEEKAHARVASLKKQI